MMSRCEIVLRGASVLDGSGSAAFDADIGIAGGRIAAVDHPMSLDAETVIDLAGLTLTPGFIDVHTHDDRQVLAAPEMWAKLSQGVTTVITGNCGISLAPLSIDRYPPPPLDIIAREASQLPVSSELEITQRVLRRTDLQLTTDGARWWVVSVFWEAETPRTPLPKKYLKSVR